MDSHPNSPWYSESLSPGFRRRKRRIPISTPNEAAELNSETASHFFPTKVPSQIQLNPIHSTAQLPNATQPHEVIASTLMGRRGSPLTVNGTPLTDMSNLPIWPPTSTIAHNYSGTNAALNTGNIHGSFPMCVHCNSRHSLGICKKTNIINSPTNNHSKEKEIGCTSNKENSHSQNYGSQQAEGNKITRNVLCSPGPFCDITNRLHSQPIRKQKRTLDRSLISDVQKGLFPDSVVVTPTKLLDYENIEQSDIVGFSDSEADSEAHSEAGDSVHSDSDATVNEGTTLTEHKAWCARMISEVPPEYDTLGAPDAVCSKCGAQMWREERNNKDVTKGLPEFSLCCKGGRLILPPIQPTPPFLQRLYDDKHRGPAFKRCIRMYNNMFSFTSMGGHVDDSINKGGAPYTYWLNGQNHHQIGALLPTEGDPPKFCQLYIYDTDNEVENRMRWIEVKDCNNVDRTVVEGLLKMLDESNHLVRCFRMARDRFKNEDIIDLKIVLKQCRSESGRENQMSTSDEVAAIMIGDADDTCGRRDIVIESKIDGLQRISDIHPLLMALQYPLLFPYGEDGFHEKIYLIKQPGDSAKVRETASMREFYCNTLMVRLAEGQTLRMGGRLWQQYVVDSFSAVEQARLWYYRSNQTQLRNELYSHICDYMKEGDGDLSNIGKSYILPASFIGSRRYMQQNFQDALAVCHFIGHPDLFLTMTCNPMWDEVLQMLALLPACKPSDCPDIIARVFKLKLQQLTDDIKKKILW